MCADSSGLLSWEQEEIAMRTSEGAWLAYRATRIMTRQHHRRPQRPDPTVILAKHLTLGALRLLRLLFWPLRAFRRWREGRRTILIPIRNDLAPLTRICGEGCPWPEGHPIRNDLTGWDL